MYMPHIAPFLTGVCSVKFSYCSVRDSRRSRFSLSEWKWAWGVRAESDARGMTGEARPEREASSEALSVLLSEGLRVVGRRVIDGESQSRAALSPFSVPSRVDKR